MMTLNASLAKNASADGGGHRRTDSSQGNILEWADKLYGQSLNTITKGVKNLLSGERVLPIAVAVETLMANQPGPESSEYAYLDPKSPHGRRTPLGGRSRLPRRYMFRHRRRQLPRVPIPRGIKGSRAHARPFHHLRLDASVRERKLSRRAASLGGVS